MWTSTAVGAAENLAVAVVDVAGEHDRAAAVNGEPDADERVSPSGPHQVNDRVRRLAARAGL